MKFRRTLMVMTLFMNGRKKTKVLVKTHLNNN